MTEKDGNLKIGESNISFGSFCWRITAVHTIAYLIAGISAMITLNYEKQFTEGFLGFLMRPLSSPIVSLGAALQLINGFFLSLILYPIRKEILGEFKSGWKKLALLVIGFTIFAPQIPGPGNLEGLIYTKIPIPIHFLSFPETILYGLLFPFGIMIWYKFNKKWMQVTSIILVILVILMSALGYCDAIGILPKK